MDLRRPLRLIQFPISDSYYPAPSRPRSVGPFSATCRPPPCKKRTPRELLWPGKRLRPGSAREETGRLESRAKDLGEITTPVAFSNEKLKEMIRFQETVRKADISFRTIWKENEENHPIVHTRRLLRPKPPRRAAPAACSFLHIVKVKRGTPRSSHLCLNSHTQTESPAEELWAHIPENSREGSLTSL